MKTILSFLLLAIFAMASTAQEVRIINRVDKQSDQRWKHEVSSSVTAAGAIDNSTFVLFDKERNLQTPTGLTGAYSITFNEQNIEFTSGTSGNIKGHLVNHTDSTLRLVFHRWQSLPNDEWNSSVCFGDACYIYFVDSLPWGNIEYYEFPAKAEAEFKLTVYAPDGANDSMTAYIQIQAINTTSDDSIGFFLGAKAIPLESVGTSQIRPNFKIQSIYPSPLVSGSSIKVKLTSPQSAGYSYAIFDNLGREVAFGSTRHQLMIGENTVEISSLDGLLTGSYLLRIKFNGGGSDAIPFQVIR